MYTTFESTEMFGIFSTNFTFVEGLRQNLILNDNAIFFGSVFREISLDMLMIWH